MLFGIYFYQQAVHMGNVLKKNGFKEKDELVLSTDNIESFLTVFWACILEGITVIPSKLNEDNLKYPVSIKEDTYKTFAENNKISLNIFTYTEEENKQLFSLERAIKILPNLRLNLLNISVFSVSITFAGFPSTVWT